jgi:hypothetical protein
MEISVSFTIVLASSLPCGLWVLAICMGRKKITAQKQNCNNVHKPFQDESGSLCLLTVESSTHAKLYSVTLKLDEVPSHTWD